MSFKFKPATAAAAFVCTAGLLATAVHAQEETSGAEDGEESPLQPVESFAEARTSLLRSDNMRRTNSGKVGDTMASAGVGLDVRRTGPKLSLAALADLDWVEFLDNTYDGQALGYLDASASWGAQTDRLQWMAEDTFGQTRSNTFANATPDNLENINYFTTGPNLNLRLGTTNTLSLQGRYSKTSYEVANFDSERLLGGVALTHALGLTSSVGVNVETESNKFDDLGALRDYDTDRAYLTVDIRGARTGLRSEVGYTKLRGPVDDSGSVYVDITADRRMGAFSSIFVKLRQQFLSSADALRMDIADGSTLGSGSTLTTADAFKDRFVQAGWTLDAARTNITVSTSYGKEEYDLRSDFDRNRSGVEAVFRRRLRPTLTLGVSARYDREKFVNVAAKYDEAQFKAELSQTFGRHVGMAISVERYDRSGSQLFADYTENRIGVGITYAFAGSR